MSRIAPGGGDCRTIDVLTKSVLIGYRRTLDAAHMLALAALGRFVRTNCRRLPGERQQRPADRCSLPVLSHHPARYIIACIGRAVGGVTERRLCVNFVVTHATRQPSGVRRPPNPRALHILRPFALRPFTAAHCRYINRHFMRAASMKLSRAAEDR